MAPQVGLEPTTVRLTAECSTTELLRNDIMFPKTLTIHGVHEIAWQRPTLTGGNPQLPSALKSLTSVFGMGTGVTSSPSLPDNIHFRKDTYNYNIFSNFFKNKFIFILSKLDNTEGNYYVI